jgi:ribosome-associated protein
MQKVSFELTADYIELNQLLKVAGLCDSGGAGKQIVADGQVKVDGRQELRKTAKIRAGQKVRIGDIQIDVIGQGGADGA